MKSLVWSPFDGLLPESPFKVVGTTHCPAFNRLIALTVLLYIFVHCFDSRTNRWHCRYLSGRTSHKLIPESWLVSVL